MVYTVFFKGINFNTINTRKMEVARDALSDTFFKNLRMSEANEATIDAIEADQEKTGIIMSCKIKYGETAIYGSVNAIPDEQFFVESWNKEFTFPTPFNINIL